MCLSTIEKCVSRYHMLGGGLRRGLNAWVISYGENVLWPLFTTKQHVYWHSFVISWLFSVLQCNLSLVRTIIHNRTNKAFLKSWRKNKGSFNPRPANSKWKCFAGQMSVCNSHVTVATNVNGNICLTCGYCQRWNGEGRKLVSVQQPALVFLYVKSVNGVGLFDQLRGSQWP